MEERGRKKREMEGAEEGGARFKRTDRVGMGRRGGFGGGVFVHCVKCDQVPGAAWTAGKFPLPLASNWERYEETPGLQTTYFNS